MKQLTKAERHEVYKELLILYSNKAYREVYNYCVNLYGRISKNQRDILLPEIAMLDGKVSRFSDNSNIQLISLMFCIEMTRP